MTRTKKDGNFINNPWTIGIGTTVISVFALRVIDWATGTTIISSIITWLTEVPNTLWLFITKTYSLPLYGLILLFLSGPIVLLGLIWLMSRKQEKGDEVNQQKPNWLNYLRDNFGGVQYRWTYEKSYSGLMEIQYIRPFCPNCDCLIIDGRCPNCNTSYWNDIKGTDEIKALILHRLERNYGVKVN